MKVNVPGVIVVIMIVVLAILLLCRDNRVFRQKQTTFQTVWNDGTKAYEKDTVIVITDLEYK
jgi:hypothetical protein